MSIDLGLKVAPSFRVAILVVLNDVGRDNSCLRKGRVSGVEKVQSSVMRQTGFWRVDICPLRNEMKLHVAGFVY